MHIVIGESFALRRYRGLTVECLIHVTFGDSHEHYLIADPLEKRRLQDFYYKSDIIHYQNPNFSSEKGGHLDSRYGTRWISARNIELLPSSNREAVTKLTKTP